MTPNRIASLGLLFAGLALFVAGRVVTGLDGDLVTAGALLLIALSFLVDALLPGGSELSDEQAVILKHSGIPYRAGAEKVVGIVCGIALLAAAAYFGVA